MSMPFYVPPEQLMKDRADFARKGIARGRALVALEHDGGIVIVAENPSTTLRKISEIYDRIAFAAVGKYNEFDQLRIGGVRAADMLGFRYSRRDVEARSLANQYAQAIGHEFTSGVKPLEVELLVAEVGDDREGDRLFHISFEGTVIDEDGFCVLGGDADLVSARLRENAPADGSLSAALKAAVAALAGPDRTLTSDDLEVACLVRADRRRRFERIEGAAVDLLLA
ncbi:MAG: proteasome subunit alpha [Actinobacteria bacterium]|jgi:proteasome alpha subunit|nr:proteasome subunit alpha [Actinomycetota bacterium]NBR66761.1 proteasome subunit alpha [Actinomycetota bacterium]NBU15409.1 proteasome subunit alpha [Actinomycetota bacterium]